MRCNPIRSNEWLSNGRDHPDNDRRFILFNLAVLKGLKVLGFKPDVIHCHDWQTG